LYSCGRRFIHTVFQIGAKLKETLTRLRVAPRRLRGDCRQNRLAAPTPPPLAAPRRTAAAGGLLLPPILCWSPAAPSWCALLPDARGLSAFDKTKAFGSAARIYCCSFQRARSCCRPYLAAILCLAGVTHGFVSGASRPVGNNKRKVS
jgi:hypothetical protein